MWMIENPDRGVCVPDDLPHDYILGLPNRTWAGAFPRPSDWTPLRIRGTFSGYDGPSLDLDDPWQFRIS